MVSARGRPPPRLAAARSSADAGRARCMASIAIGHADGAAAGRRTGLAASPIPDWHTMNRMDGPPVCAVCRRHPVDRAGGRSAASAASCQIWRGGPTAPIECRGRRSTETSNPTTTTTPSSTRRAGSSGRPSPPWPPTPRARVPVAMADTLTITDNRTGKTVRSADHGRHHPRHWTCGRSRRGEDDFGLMHLRPGVHEHGGVPQQDHLHRRRQGHPDVPRLPDRAAGREQHLSRDGLPDPVRRAADRRASWRRGRDEITHAHDAAREHQEVHGRVPLRRPSDGRVPQHRRRALHVLPRRQADLRRRVAHASRSTG